MIEHTLRFTLPAAYALLPEGMATPAASAMLLAIGLQESGFLERRQGAHGPARGFWQFERGGIAGILTHVVTAPFIASALTKLRYPAASLDADRCHELVADNDTVACVFARLLLWTLPDTLPIRETPMRAWSLYLDGWRPGNPHVATWTTDYAEAWDRVDVSRLHLDQA